MFLTAKQTSIGCILLAVLLDQIGVSIIIPIMPSLLAEITQNSVANNAVIGGWLVAVYGLVQFVFSPIMGALSDRFGRKLVLICCFSVFCIDYLLFAIADNLYYLFIARFIAGMAGSSVVVCLAAVSDVSLNEEKTTNFAYVFAAMGLGLIIGPALSSFLVDMGVKSVFYCAAGLSLAGLVLIVLFFDETLRHRTSEFKPQLPFKAMMYLGKQYPRLINIFLIKLLFSLAVQAPLVLWAFFTKHRFSWTDKEIALSFLVLGILGFFIQSVLIKYLYPKLGNRKIIYLGFVCFGVGTLLMAFSTTPTIFYIALTIYSFAQVGNSAMRSLYSSWVKDSEQGLVMGVQQSIVSICFVAGPILMTYLYKTTSNWYYPLSDGYPFLVSAGITLICIVILKRVFNEEEKHDR